MELEVTTEEVGAVRIVRMTGELGTNSAEVFDARMRELLDSGYSRVVLDLAQVTYVSSMGLRSLMVVAKALKARDGALALAAVGRRVQEVLDIAGFTPLFLIVATTEDAIARMQPDR